MANNNAINNNIGVATGTSLNLGSSTTMTGMIDDDTFATASASTAASSESIKAYVDGLVGAGGVVKNLFIGGDFALNPWQRGTSFTAPLAGEYSADRIALGNSTDGVINITKTADAPTVAEANYFTSSCLNVTVTTADAAIGAAQIAYVNQKMEGYNFAAIAQRSFTLSFWVKATVTGTYCVAFQNSGSDRYYIAEYTINAASTWEYKTITVSASPSAGTWNYTNGIGLFIAFILASGTDFHGTANSWQTGALFATSNQVNAFSAINNTFRLALVQVEAGSTDTPFEIRTVQEELELCQRYYWKTFAQGVTPAQNIGSSVGCTPYRAAFTGVGNGGMQVSLPVVMRTTPTIIGYNPNAANALWRNQSSGADSGSLTINSAGDRGFFANNVQLAGDNVGSQINIHLTATAEF